MEEAWEDVALTMNLANAPASVVRKIRFVFYSGVFYGLIAQGSVEQLKKEVLDILKNVTTNPPDRVKEFSFKASGGSYAKLFDGTEKLLSWDNILWINRTVLLP